MVSEPLTFNQATTIRQAIKIEYLSHLSECDMVDISLAGYIFTRLWPVKIESPAREISCHSTL